MNPAPPSATAPAASSAVIRLISRLLPCPSLDLDRGAPRDAYVLVLDAGLDLLGQVLAHRAGLRLILFARREPDVRVRLAHELHAPRLRRRRDLDVRPHGTPVSRHAP